MSLFVNWIDLNIDWHHPATKLWTLGILVGILGCTFIYNVKLSPALSQEKQLTQRLQEARAKLGELEQYQRYQTHFEKASLQMGQDLLQVEQALPLQWNLVKLNQAFFQALRVSQLRLKKQVFLPEREFDHYSELKILMELTGQYPQLLALVTEIKQMPWLVNIRKLEVENPILQQQKPELYMRMELSIYRRQPIEKTPLTTKKSPPRKD